MLCTPFVSSLHFFVCVFSAISVALAWVQDIRAAANALWHAGMFWDHPRKKTFCFHFGTPWPHLPATAFGLPGFFFFFFLSRYRPRTRGLYQPAKHGGFHLFLMEQWMDKKNSGGIRDMEERKERRNKSKAYSNGLLSHYSGTGLSRPADQPPKESPHPLYKTLFIQPTLSYFSSGTKATKSLRFPSCPHPICVSRLS